MGKCTDSTAWFTFGVYSVNTLTPILYTCLFNAYPKVSLSARHRNWSLYISYVSATDSIYCVRKRVSGIDSPVRCMSSQRYREPSRCSAHAETHNLFTSAPRLEFACMQHNIGSVVKLELLGSDCFRLFPPEIEHRDLFVRRLSRNIASVSDLNVGL